jgi:hypothetical protein
MLEQSCKTLRKRCLNAIKCDGSQNDSEESNDQKYITAFMILTSIQSERINTDQIQWVRHQHRF